MHAWLLPAAAAGLRHAHVLLLLLQNADDAKATSVRFCIDHNTYGTGAGRSTRGGVRTHAARARYTRRKGAGGSSAASAGAQHAGVAIMQPYRAASPRLPAGSLLSAGMAGFQGPALLAFNDGVFSERDFESISRIGDSQKRQQSGKTGRFG